MVQEIAQTRRAFDPMVRLNRTGMAGSIPVLPLTIITRETTDATIQDDTHGSEVGS